MQLFSAEVAGSQTSLPSLTRRNGRPAGRQARRRKMYYVYVLRCLRTGEYYKGISDNVERRLREHEIGKCKYISTRLPVELVHVEVCDNRSQARVLEKYFKSGSGREAIKEIIAI